MLRAAGSLRFEVLLVRSIEMAERAGCCRTSYCTGTPEKLCWSRARGEMADCYYKIQRGKNAYIRR